MSTLPLHKSKLASQAPIDPAPAARRSQDAVAPVGRPLAPAPKAPHDSKHFKSHKPGNTAPPAPRPSSTHTTRSPHPKAARKPARIAPCVSDLLQVLQDRRLAYQHAAGKVHSNRLRGICMRYSAQSQQFLDDLTPILARYGPVIPPSGSLLGALSRGWVSVGKVLRTGDRPILAACERGDDAAIARYTECLESDSLTAQLLPIIARQYNDLLAAHDTICDWRDSL